MNKKTPFSERFGFKPQQEPEITVRLDAPKELRGVVILLADKFSLSPEPLREIICQVLLVRPNRSNWSEYPNIDDENHQLLDGATWYKVYDVIEAVSTHLKKIKGSVESEAFASRLNSYFIEQGIGWKLTDGYLEARNPEALEQSIKAATQALNDAGNKTAQKELHEALVDLSRRPKPDVTGAIQHSMAALECVFRNVVGNPKATLGELLKKHPNIIPPPLDQSLDKLWGYASEFGRHIREDREPEFSEAQLVVGVSAAVVTYLVNMEEKL
ncbi:AbiJ-NTD4 domain-containing protein [Paenalcaligenes hominis]|uniref:AbiJ-NTD4 domain-containing protein n=1 Tax=Paenalcaligenes hominis TaxID=643674 RepID=UPI003524D043